MFQTFLEDALQILLGLREKYESHHKCLYTSEAINAAVHLSARYIPDRYLPDKAIDLIDEAGSRACIEAFTGYKLTENDDTSRMEEDSKLTFKTSFSDDETAVVGPEDIAAVASLCSRNGYCQDEAVSAICRAVKRSRVGLKDPDRPIAAMLFCGPTGVGKTELTKALAASYLESAMLRLDMSEYMERHTMRLRKAHPDIFNILLQLFEDGHLTDSQRKLLWVFTAEDDSTSYAGMKALLMEELKGYFRPELLNRIDEVVVFRPLEKPQMLEILDIMLHEVKERLNTLGIGLELQLLIIEDLVSESLLSGDYKPGDIAVIDLDDSGNPIVTNKSNKRIQLSDTASNL
ncbi:hypothetical protein BUALT_Bualt07G0106800 [Buddleja alternifolia]|uniref:Uncharacterized protein n=1 Tax=Buddleja alternifolia TaxID=168488 RepID=A0AAV6X9W4_9LAMI|nr:hypothetical protein BUALT_Bualt07G0106800 [Buddleja alternifolia]